MACVGVARESHISTDRESNENHYKGLASNRQSLFLSRFRERVRFTISCCHFITVLTAKRWYNTPTSKNYDTRKVHTWKLILNSHSRQKLIQRDNKKHGNMHGYGGSSTSSA